MTCDICFEACVRLPQRMCVELYSVYPGHQVGIPYNRVHKAPVALAGHRQYRLRPMDCIDYTRGGLYLVDSDLRYKVITRC